MERALNKYERTLRDARDANQRALEAFVVANAERTIVKAAMRHCCASKQG